MNSETARIADQLRRAFRGEAWHGPSLLDLLAEITPEQARARPLRSAHSIWELVLHIDIYLRAGFEATQGAPMPKLYGTEERLARPASDSAVAWFDAQDKLFRSCRKAGARYREI